MGFADLKSDLVGAFENAASIFGLGGGLPYPAQYAYVTNTIDENDKSWRKSVGYRFRVVRVSNGKVTNADGWTDFTLQINPETLTQDEIFAIEVTPTFTGVSVEHQGVTLKDISISGTTGISPNRRGLAGAYPQNGRPASGKGRSGYAEFHELRNFIRAYVEQKRQDPDRDAGELRLIWDNLKDHESIYIEPQKFQMKRSARKPFMYDYAIQFKGIGIATEANKEGSWLEALDNGIEDALGFLEAGSKMIQGAADFITRVEQEFLAVELAFCNAVIGAIKAGGNLSNNFRNASSSQTINKFSIENMVKRIDSVRDNTYDITLGDNVAGYNQAKGREATLTAVGARTPTYDEIVVAKALGNLKKGLIAVLAADRSKTLNPSPNDIKNAINNAYKKAGFNKFKSASSPQAKALQAEIAKAKLAGNVALVKAKTAEYLKLVYDINSAFGSSANVQVIDTSTETTKDVTVQGGMTIQGLAVSLLGSADRYKELVTINKLVPPYVETTVPTITVGGVEIVDESAKRPGVLYPGDKIKVPTKGTLQSMGASSSAQEASITKNLTEVQKRFGVDLLLNDNFDLDFTSTNDFRLIASVENVAQAILLKILTGLGSLKSHPTIGTDLGIGEKATNTSLLADQVRTSLLTDSRVDSVIYVRVEQNGGTVEIIMVIKLKDVDEPLRIPLKLPNAA